LSLTGRPIWRLEQQRGIGSRTGVGEWEGGIGEGSDDGVGEEDDGKGSSEERDDREGEGGEGDVCDGFGKGEEGDVGKEFGKAGGVIVCDRETSGVGEKELGRGYHGPQEELGLSPLEKEKWT